VTVTSYEDHIAVIGSTTAPKTFPSCAYAFVLGPRTLMVAVAPAKGSRAHWEGQVLHYRQASTVARVIAASNAVLNANASLTKTG